MRRDRSAKHITAAYRRVKAMELRQQALSYKDIGEQLGCSTQRAHAIVHEEFARLRAEQNELAENILRQTNDRIEALLKVQMQSALKGDRLATETALKLIDRQARLFGVDAPRKNETRIEVTAGDPEQLRAKARMMGVDLTDLEDDGGQAKDAASTTLTRNSPAGGPGADGTASSTTDG
jgi:hypothetical protein